MGNPFAKPDLPETMAAVQLQSYGGPDQLVAATVPLPRMAPHNEVLIRVEAAGVNPFEAKLRRGWLDFLFPLQHPHILGTDVAGTIVHKGFDVSEFEVGDRVYGLLDPTRSGSYAEYVSAPSYLVRKMPANLSFEEAAAVPMAACTAWYGLVDLGRIGPGSRVLVQAASGGVGAFAVQIAKAHGAWVAATCSTRNLDFVRSLGADHVIDYTQANFCDQLTDIDVALDVLGGEVNANCYKVLKQGGTLLVVLRGDQVELGHRWELMAKHGVTTKEVAFSAQPEILDKLRPLIEAGKVRVPIEAVLPLAEAAKAHALLDAGKRQGKIVLKTRTAAGEAAGGGERQAA